MYRIPKFGYLKTIEIDTHNAYLWSLYAYFINISMYECMIYKKSLSFTVSFSNLSFLYYYNFYVLYVFLEKRDDDVS